MIRRDLFILGRFRAVLCMHPVWFQSWCSPMFYGLELGWLQLLWRRK